LFNDWLKHDWLPSYRARYLTLDNVAVFDFFNTLAYPDTAAAHPNRLKQEYGGNTGDSHPNPTANADATDAFTRDLNNFLDGAWADFTGQPHGFGADPFHVYIECIAARSITVGCGGGNYCPDTPTTRAQMAVFLEKGKRGATFVPPLPTGQFTDLPTSYWAAGWIEQLFADGITTGCGEGNFCPDLAVTRAQMAVFLLKAKYGSTYTPPAQIGVFGDMPIGHWAGPWIERLAAEGITAGCGSGVYCPDNPVTRGQMAVFLTKTFGF